MLKQICFLGILCSISLVSFSQEAFYGNGNFYIFPGAEMGVFGDLGNDGTFQSTGGTVYLVGASLQNITGTSPVNINDLILDNANNIKLDNQLAIKDAFTFTNGKVYSDRTDYASEFLHFLAGATYTGFDNTHFVDGVVRKTGNTAFVFPVGSGTDAQTISMNAPTGTNDAYTAFYNYVDPQIPSYDPTSFESGLNNVSRCEYWVFDPIGSPSIVTLSLNFDVNSCGITAMEDLRVVRWDGTKWENLGNASTTGTPSDGMITSFKSCNTCGTYNPVTIASISSLNPLPIVLLNFNAVLNDRHTDLIWQTASEHNNDYFTVERSTDGFNFEPLQYVDGAGNSNSLLSYSTIDPNPANGYTYYRLKQTDFDGAFDYSEIRSVYLGATDELSVYPNPSTGIVNFTAQQEGLFSLFTSEGKLIQENTISGTVSLSLASGMYLARFNSGNKQQLIKIIVNH